MWDLHHAGTVAPPAPVPVPAPKVPEAGLFRELTKTFAPEIQQLKGLAIGSLMALARDTIKRSMASGYLPGRMFASEPRISVSISTRTAESCRVAS